MTKRVAVIGAGIVGIAYAWRLAVRGVKVTLFERSKRAEGASVRNFGMVWPIGQPIEHLDTALLSRSLWEEFLHETRAWSGPGGSVHLATREDELRVLTEFADSELSHGYDCRLASTSEVQQVCPAARNKPIIGGLLSQTEIGVDPREVIAAAPSWLSERYGVELAFETCIAEIDLPAVRSTKGEYWEFDEVVVASGADFATLYADVFADNALAKCKLQMMRTAPQPDGWRVGPMVASGLTLRHYPTFKMCPGIESLRQRIAEETPELDRYGIHVMAAQNGSGEVVLGDSHEYGGDITPFDSDEITRLMLRELRSIIDLPNWELLARWHGIYAIDSLGAPQFVHRPAPGVTIVIATGGCGMTMSFGLAEQWAARQGVTTIARNQPSNSPQRA